MHLVWFYTSSLQPQSKQKYMQQEVLRFIFIFWGRHLLVVKKNFCMWNRNRVLFNYTQTNATTSMETIQSRNSTYLQITTSSYREKTTCLSVSRVTVLSLPTLSFFGNSLSQKSYQLVLDRWNDVKIQFEYF